MSTPKRDTMHLRNKAAIGITLCLVSVGVLLSATAWVGAQENAAAQPRKVVPTPLPSDVDPSDPAIPIWMRPAPTAAAASTPAPGQPGNVPPGQQAPGQQAPG